jgi:hypothetical protein
LKLGQTLMKLTNLMAILGDDFPIKLLMCIPCCCLRFGHSIKNPKFTSRAKPEDDQFDTSTEVSAQQPKQKKQQQVVDGEAIAAAVSSLVPSKEEQEERILLLREEKLIKKSQEKRDYQSLKHSEYEKFFSNDLALPPAIKEQLQEKMSKLAQDFLSNKF